MTQRRYILTRSFTRPTIKYTEALSAHSPYFAALFAHPFAESQSRIVDVHLPCVAALEPTLFHLHTGRAPPLFDGKPGGVDADRFFGLLANAKYLLLDTLVQQCTDMLAELIKADCHQGKGWMGWG